MTAKWLRESGVGGATEDSVMSGLLSSVLAALSNTLLANTLLGAGNAKVGRRVEGQGVTVATVVVAEAVVDDG